MDSASRRFQLSDTLILVAATAASLALARYYWRTPTSFIPKIAGGRVSYQAGYIPLSLRGVELTLSLVLAAFSPALLAMSLKRPRPLLMILFRQPGFWASLLGTVASLVYLGRQVVLSRQHGGYIYATPAAGGAWGETPTPAILSFDMFPLLVFTGLRVSVGFWMVCVLVPLLIVGKWRKPLGWLEISGRCLGVLWILLYLETWRLPPWS